MTSRRLVAAAVLDLLRALYVLAWLGLFEGYAAAYNASHQPAGSR